MYSAFFTTNGINIKLNMVFTVFLIKMSVCVFLKAAVFTNHIYCFNIVIAVPTEQ